MANRMILNETSYFGTGAIAHIVDEVIPNPTIAVVERGIERFKASQADYLIAIGGGSPQDTCKAIGIIINNPNPPMSAAWKALRPPDTLPSRLSRSRPPPARPQKSLSTTSSLMKKNTANLCAPIRMTSRLSPSSIPI